MLRWIARTGETIRRRLRRTRTDADAVDKGGGDGTGNSTETDPGGRAKPENIARATPVRRGGPPLASSEVPARGQSGERRGQKPTTRRSGTDRSDDEGWTTLTHKLPTEARNGNEVEIVEWLAEESRKRKHEVVVWINRTGKYPQAEAGTSGEAAKVKLPKTLLARLKDRDERIELWHNHPAGVGVPSIAVPSPEDIAVATMPGVAGVTTVDDEGNAMRVISTEPRFERPDIVKNWTRRAGVLMHRRLFMERIRLRLPLDERAESDMAIEVAKATVGAAVAARLIDAETLSERAMLDGRELATATNADIGTPAELADTTKRPRMAATPPIQVIAQCAQRGTFGGDKHPSRRASGCAQQVKSEHE